MPERREEWPERTESLFDRGQLLMPEEALDYNLEKLEQWQERERTMSDEERAESDGNLRITTESIRREFDRIVRQNPNMAMLMKHVATVGTEIDVLKALIVNLDSQLKKVRAVPVGDGEHAVEVLIDQPASTPKTERAERCETCRYVYGTKGLYHGDDQWVCRRFPTCEEKKIDDWCGEWKPCRYRLKQ